MYFRFKTYVDSKKLTTIIIESDCYYNAQIKAKQLNDLGAAIDVHTVVAIPLEEYQDEMFVFVPVSDDNNTAAYDEYNRLFGSFQQITSPKIENKFCKGSIAVSDIRNYVKYLAIDNPRAVIKTFYADGTTETVDVSMFLN